MLWMFHILCLGPIGRSWGLEIQSRGLWRARALPSYVRMCGGSGQRQSLTAVSADAAAESNQLDSSQLSPKSFVMQNAP